jgi:hypothetical protein
MLAVSLSLCLSVCLSVYLSACLSNTYERAHTHTHTHAHAHAHTTIFTPDTGNHQCSFDYTKICQPNYFKGWSKIYGDGSIAAIAAPYRSLVQTLSFAGISSDGNWSLCKTVKTNFPRNEVCRSDPSSQDCYTDKHWIKEEGKILCDDAKPSSVCDPKRDLPSKKVPPGIVEGFDVSSGTKSALALVCALLSSVCVWLIL